MNMARKAWLVPVLAAAAVCSASTLAAQEEEQEEGNQGCRGKGRYERSGVARARSGGERQSRPADFRQVRDGGGQTAALRLHDERRQVLRGDRRPQHR